jgi:iron complex outermembrane receptor protein
MSCPLLRANAHDNDTLQTIRLQEVEVISTRATRTTPVAFTNVTKEQLSKQNFGTDIPWLLSFTPSVLTTSDAGAGIGYTSIRIRGTDASRINVTTNGIPMNDAESNSLYWVNTPDFASSLQDIQVQRGVGTSTNGAGSFGGSINMKTQGISPVPYAEFSGSYGSFHTHKETAKAGTGIMGDHWGFDVRISNIHSDGYRDRARADLKSYFAQAGYYADHTTLKFITFGGKEETYHAWDGITAEQLKTDRKFNPNGAIHDDEGNIIGFYDNQIDLYKQTHYQLLLTQDLSPRWILHAALHYTDGSGYYEEYKNKRTLTEYGLLPFTVDGTLVKKSDLVRRKYVSSDFGGGIVSADYKGEQLTASVGGGFNFYENDHYGRVLWVKNYVGDLAPDHEYYRNTGRKSDGNIYAKANYQLTQGLSVYADLQYRFLRYRINGVGDQWDYNASPERMQQLNVDESFNFFNPKGGLFWNINRDHSLYASVGVAHKEPTRNNYTDNLLAAHPKAERLTDFELGYNYRSKSFQGGVNLYYMDYHNQLVVTGALNEIGEPMTENVKNSYRTGIEATAGVRITSWLQWDVNATWSRNRLKSEGGSNRLALSPDIMANSLITFHYKGIDASFQSQYVGRQYLDNSNDHNCTLDPWFVNNLNLSYTFKVKGIKAITLGASIYNLFNEMYESNGYVSDGTPIYYANAGINALGHITLKF